MQRFLPLILVLGMLGMFLYLMTEEDRNPNEIKSVMIGRPAPAFDIAGLGEGATRLSDADLYTGKPILVNFFASWCVPCRAEHENLMLIGQKYGIPIIGIAYKDKPEKSAAFLAELGNPYSKIGTDLDGRVAIDWGVTGVPETFLIKGDGTIAYRAWGPLVGDAFAKKLLPAMEALK